jgi:SAM-dependent methyltransferase
MTCRICSSSTEEILDLGFSPPANSLLNSPIELQESFPLVLELCSICHNVQLRDCISAIDLYRNYLYVTPNSSILSSHYNYLYKFLESSGYIKSNSFVLEVGSNIGLFLNYIKDKVHRVLGIDPAINICSMAIDAGIDTVCDFFNASSASEIRKIHGQPDLIVARHCFAHNSDPHILMRGVSELLSDSGHVVIENAYILNTIENNEFDQVYHEHMFYYSIRSMKALLEANGLRLVDVIFSLVHGGSIIFVAKHVKFASEINSSVAQYLAREEMFLDRKAFNNFAARSVEIKKQLLDLIHQLRSDGKVIYTYGATAKGNTLLNFLGITSFEIPLCIDNTDIKKGKFLPKSNIRVISEKEGVLIPPDYYLLTAWNYKDEIINKVRESGNYHTKFIIPFPYVHII